MWLLWQSCSAEADLPGGTGYRSPYPRLAWSPAAHRSGRAPVTRRFEAAGAMESCFLVQSELLCPSPLAAVPHPARDERQALHATKPISASHRSMLGDIFCRLTDVISAQTMRTGWGRCVRWGTCARPTCSPTPPSVALAAPRCCLPPLSVLLRLSCFMRRFHRPLRSVALAANANVTCQNPADPRLRLTASDAQCHLIIRRYSVCLPSGRA